MFINMQYKVAKFCTAAHSHIVLKVNCGRVFKIKLKLFSHEKNFWKFCCDCNGFDSSW